MSIVIIVVGTISAVVLVACAIVLLQLNSQLQQARDAAAEWQVVQARESEYRAAAEQRERDLLDFIAMAVAVAGEDVEPEPEPEVDSEPAGPSDEDVATAVALKDEGATWAQVADALGVTRSVATRLVNRARTH